MKYYFIWKSYIKVTDCCYFFKGSHNIPVTKTWITHTAQPWFSLYFLIFFSFNLFFPYELIIILLMGFLKRGVESGERVQGRTQHRMTPLYQQWAGRGWAPSSWLNDFPEEMWFWHRVRLYCHTQMYGGYLTRPLAVHETELWEDDAYFVTKGSMLSVKRAELHCAVIGSWLLPCPSGFETFWQTALRFFCSSFLFFTSHLATLQSAWGLVEFPQLETNGCWQCQPQLFKK